MSECKIEFKIDAVGSYRQRDGGRAEVKFIDGDRAYGRDSQGESHLWRTADGTEANDFYPGLLNLVSRWPRFAVGDNVRVNDGIVQRKYATVVRQSPENPLRYMVKSGSWSAWMDESELVPDDRPTPPEGFRLMPTEYVACEEDMVWTEGSGRWAGVLHWAGMSAKQLNYKRSFDKHYIASPLKPAEPEQWVPTCEHRTKTGDATGCATIYWSSIVTPVIERKWMCGDKSEWRPIPVEVTE